MTGTPDGTYIPSDDKQLIEQIKVGNYAAFTMLYNKYIKNLTHYGLKFTDDITIVQDCLHDTFVWFWTKRKELEIHSSLKGYLFKSVRTAVLHTIKKQRSYRQGLYEFSAVVSDEYQMIENETLQLRREQVGRLLLQLTSKQREILYLRYYEGLSFEDISRNMNLTTKAAYKLMGRAIASLRESGSLSLLLLAGLLHRIFF